VVGTAQLPRRATARLSGVMQRLSVNTRIGSHRDE
jgi:hypothetical protein